MCSQAALRGLAIAGSLRHASFNRATLRAAQQLAPEGAKIESFDIAPGPRMYGGGFFAPWPKRYVHVSKLRMSSAPAGSAVRRHADCDHGRLARRPPQQWLVTLNLIQIKANGAAEA